jgi:hypothetical protein
MQKAKKEKVTEAPAGQPLSPVLTSGKRGPRKGAEGGGRPRHYAEPKQSKGVSLTQSSMEFFFNELGGSKGLESIIRGEHPDYALAKITRAKGSGLQLTEKASAFLKKKLGGAEGLEALLSGQHKEYALAKLYHID